MPSYYLGRDQTVTVDNVMAGVREIELEVASKSTNVTAFDEEWETTLVLSRRVRVRLTALTKDVFDVVWPKFNSHPPQTLSISITNVGTVTVVPVSVTAGVPINGLLTWDMEFASWSKV